MLVVTDDVRVALREGQDYTTSLPAHRTTGHDPVYPRVTLKSEAYNAILQMISPTTTASADDPHRRIGLEYTDEEDESSLKVESFIRVDDETNERMFSLKNMTNGEFEVLSRTIS